VEAGTLKSTEKQKVEVQPAPPPVSSEGEAQPAAPQQTVIIQPAEQGVVYAPQYNLATESLVTNSSPLMYDQMQRVAYDETQQRRPTK